MAVVQVVAADMIKSNEIQLVDPNTGGCETHLKGQEMIKKIRKQKKIHHVTLIF